jgi:hypothetical protein
MVTSEHNKQSCLKVWRAESTPFVGNRVEGFAPIGAAPLPGWSGKKDSVPIGTRS